MIAGCNGYTVIICQCLGRQITITTHFLNLDLFRIGRYKIYLSTFSYYFLLLLHFCIQLDFIAYNQVDGQRVPFQDQRIIRNYLI